MRIRVHGLHSRYIARFERIENITDIRESTMRITENVSSGLNLAHTGAQSASVVSHSRYHDGRRNKKSLI